MATNSKAQNVAENLHRAVLLFQRRLRQARLDHLFPLEPTPALVLTLLSNDDSLTPTGIAKASGLPISMISRIIATLQQSGYIRSFQSHFDRRSKDLVFTEKGEALLSELDAINNEVSLRGVHPLKKGEREEFARLLKGLNDALQFPSLASRTTELPIFTERRRLARGTGMVGDQYLSSGIDLETYQILFELWSTAREIRFNELCVTLPIHQSKISRTLSTYERKGLLKKGVPAGDRRGIVATLTEKGREHFRKIHLEATAVFSQALRSFSTSDAERFIELVEILTSAELPEPKAKQLECLPCRTEEELKSARRVLVQALVQGDRHHNLESELLPCSNFCARFLRGGAPFGVLEIDPKRGVTHFELLKPESHGTANSTDSKLLDRSALLMRGIESYFVEKQATTVRLPPDLAEELHLPATIRRKG